MSKWVTTYQLIGSNNEKYTVSIDADGNYGCSCPAWKFKKQECKHIIKIKENLQLYARRPGEKGLPALPGNVGEVTVCADKILYPLVPVGWYYTSHLIATIIYDINRAGADSEYVMAYKDRMLSHISMGAVDRYIRQNGRLIYTKWVKGQGWCELAAVPADTPLRRLDELKNAG